MNTHNAKVMIRWVEVGGGGDTVILVWSFHHFTNNAAASMLPDAPSLQHGTVYRNKHLFYSTPCFVGVREVCCGTQLLRRARKRCTRRQPLLQLAMLPLVSAEALASDMLSLQLLSVTYQAHQQLHVRISRTPWSLTFWLEDFPPQAFRMFRATFARKSDVTSTCS